MINESIMDRNKEIVNIERSTWFFSEKILDATPG